MDEQTAAQPPLELTIVGFLMLIDHAATLLRAQGDHRDADWLERDAGYIRDDDFYGVEHILKGFGGLGSLTDAGLHGSPLDLLLSDIQRIALELRREYNRVPPEADALAAAYRAAAADDEAEREALEWIEANPDEGLERSAELVPDP